MGNSYKFSDNLELKQVKQEFKEKKVKGIENDLQIKEIIEENKNLKKELMELYRKLKSFQDTNQQLQNLFRNTENQKRSEKENIKIGNE